MTDLLRQEVATSADTIVVKVGTRVLTHSTGTLNQDRIADLSQQINRLIESGRRVVLVSSGAVGAGMDQLGISSRPTDLSHLQAIAAIGQTKLIESYDRTFRGHGRHAAQVLLTAEDINDHARFLNVRNTLLALLEFGAVPIVNENDTVAVDELMTTFGDNDYLAAQVTNLILAPLLVILSDVEGLFDGDPDDTGTRLVETVSQLDATALSYVRDRQTGVSKGGMASKLEAARIASTCGGNVIIAGGYMENVLGRIVAGESVGTLVLARDKTISLKKRWIGLTAQVQGRLSLDDGATRAVEKGGKSLLAVGIVKADGQFSKGDVVAICDASGREFARGLTNYSSNEIGQIKSIRSEKIAEILGHCPYSEVVHRDNMTLVGGS